MQERSAEDMGMAVESELADGYVANAASARAIVHEMMGAEDDFS